MRVALLIVSSTVNLMNYMYLSRGKYIFFKNLFDLSAPIVNIMRRVQWFALPLLHLFLQRSLSC